MQSLRWNTADDSYSRTNFLNSETKIYYILSWIFVQRHKTVTSSQSLGNSSYLMFIVCFSSCVVEVPWRRWWEQCIILLSCSGNSYSRYMLGQGYETMCVPDFNVTINWKKVKFYQFIRSFLSELNGEETWKCRRFKFVPNNFFLTQEKLETDVRLYFMLLLETVIQIALSAY